VDVAKGTFLSQNVDGATRSVTGLSFQPKLVFLWASVRSAVGIGATGGQITFGAATSSSDQGVVVARSRDNQGTSDANKYQRSDGCFVHIEDTGVLQGYCTFTSFNSDGFTVTWTDAMTVQWPIHYLAIGGTDLDSVKVGNFQITSSGSQDVTGVGFDPDAVMVFGCRQDSVSAGSAHAHFHMGASDGTTTWAQAFVDEDASGFTDGATTFSASELVRVFDDTGAVDCQATFTSFISDGFRINVTNAPAATIRVFYVAFNADGAVDVQHDTKPVTDTTKATTAQDPDAVLLMTVCAANDDTTTTSANTTGAGVASVEVGAMTSAAQGMSGFWVDDNLNTSNVASSEATDKVMLMGDPSSTTPATMGTAAYSALGATDYTLSWTSTNATALRFGSVTFGVPAAAPSYTSRLALMGVG
jgi:hypothetical protein